jgi:hypothetical protein
LGGGKGYLDFKETYCMFMMIHGLVTHTDQEIAEEEFQELERATTLLHRGGTQLGGEKEKKKRDINFKHFEYIYKNKVAANLEEKGRFRFTEMNVLLNAYEYWRYESSKTQNFDGQAENSGSFIGGRRDSYNVMSNQMSPKSSLDKSRSSSMRDGNKRICGCGEEFIQYWSVAM